MALTLFLFYTMPFGSVGAMLSQMEKETSIEKVIILKGAGGRGKTPTLHLLIDLLISKGATRIHDDGYTSDIHQDCFVILNLPCFGNVGIITYGDRGCETDVQNALNECFGRGCRVVVGASHMQYYKNPPTVYKILWDFGSTHHAKTVETTTIIKADGWGQPINEISLNAICAENLFNLLLKL